MVFPLYELLNVLSDGEVVKKTLDKENNWIVSLLYEFLHVFSDYQVVQKTLDREHNWMASLLYELACLLSADESLKDLSHTEHLKRLSKWTFKWILRMSDVGKDSVHWVQQWRFSLAVVASSLKLLSLSNNIFKIVSTKEFRCLCTYKKNYKHTYSSTCLPTLLAGTIVEQGTGLGYRHNTAYYIREE